MKNFKGDILFLDRSDINTDEIIPAKYLTENSKEALKSYLLEDLKLDSFSPKNDIAGKAAVVSRANFGCGSSREHAPWALEVNGINAVIAVNFARIFRQNMFNCGMLAIELPEKTIDRLFKEYSGRNASLEIDVEKESITVSADGKSENIPFVLDGFNKALVQAEGWVGYADGKY
jgi:3-isopropylmalate/(R)-2-methylmalate dehydratase small subunit